MKPYSFFKFFLFATAVGLLCLPPLAIAQGSLVVNGGFDTDASGWTFTGGFYDGKYGDPAGCLALIGPTASASQTISGLTSGATYVVSGVYQGVAGGSPSDLSFQVAMNGSVLYEIAAPTDDNWDAFSVLYTASTTGAVLDIGAFSDPGAGGYVIDNISVVAVPEPSAWVLTVLGGGALIYCRARRIGGSVN